MKLRKLFVALSALTLSFGASVAAMTTFNKATEESVTTEAAQNTYTFYVAINTSYTVKVYYNAGYSTTGLVTLSKNGSTYHGLSIYTASIKDSGQAVNFDEVDVQLFDGGTWKEQRQIISSWNPFTHSGQLFLYGSNSWITYSTDPATTSKTLYIDATKWSSMGSNVPKCHYWIEWGDGNTTNYDDVAGTNLTSVSGGGTYANKKWWSFTINPNGTSGLKFLFMYNSYAVQTANISYNSTKNAYYLSGTSGYAPESEFSSNGSIYKITTYKKNADNAATTLNTYYVLGGESFETPSIPTADTGYAAPSKWNTSSDGSGTAYSQHAWISNITSNQTLYALYTVAVYTITYDRNMQTGLQETQQKDVGVSVNAYTPGTSPLNASGWNPSFAKRFVHWNTSYDDKGVTYLAGGTINVDNSFYLYYIEDWYKFRYRVDDGSWINLVQNDEGKGDGVKAQFAPSTAQTLPLHGKLSFQYSANNGSTWNDLNSVSFSGNYDSTEGIELMTVDTIYLKVMSTDTYVCWVPGISDRTICVFDTSSATTGGTPYTMRGDGDSQTVTTVDVYIEKGQFVKRGYSGNYTYGTYFAGGTGNAGTAFSQVGSDTAVECLVTGVYTVYNQKGEYSNWKDLWFTRNEAASAKALAQQFNTIIGAMCTSINSGSKGLSDLQNIWGSKSGTTLYKHFNNQYTATMNYFTGATATSDEDILACIEKYNYIENKYGTTALPNFLGRSDSYKSAPGFASPLNFVGNNSNTLIVVVLVSSSIVAAGVGGFFLLRKRKEQ